MMNDNTATSSRNCRKRPPPEVSRVIAKSAIEERRGGDGGGIGVTEPTPPRPLGKQQNQKQPAVKEETKDRERKEKYLEREEEGVLVHPNPTTTNPLAKSHPPTPRSQRSVASPPKEEEEQDAQQDDGHRKLTASSTRGRSFASVAPTRKQPARGKKSTPRKATKGGSCVMDVFEVTEDDAKRFVASGSSAGGSGSHPTAEGTGTTAVKVSAPPFQPAAAKDTATHAEIIVVESDEDVDGDDSSSNNGWTTADHDRAFLHLANARLVMVPTSILKELQDMFPDKPRQLLDNLLQEFLLLKGLAAAPASFLKAHADSPTDKEGGDRRTTAATAHVASSPSSSSCWTNMENDLLYDALPAISAISVEESASASSPGDKMPAALKKEIGPLFPHKSPQEVKEKIQEYYSSSHSGPMSPSYRAHLERKRVEQAALVANATAKPFCEEGEDDRIVGLSTWPACSTTSPLLVDLVEVGSTPPTATEGTATTMAASKRKKKGKPTGTDEGAYAVYGVLAKPKYLEHEEENESANDEQAKVELLEQGALQSRHAKNSAKSHKGGENPVSKHVEGLDKGKYAVYLKRKRLHAEASSKASTSPGALDRNAATVKAARPAVDSAARTDPPSEASRIIAPVEPSSATATASSAAGGATGNSKSEKQQGQKSSSLENTAPPPVAQKHPCRKSANAAASPIDQALLAAPSVSYGSHHKQAKAQPHAKSKPTHDIKKPASTDDRLDTEETEMPDEAAVATFVPTRSRRIAKRKAMAAMKSTSAQDDECFIIVDQPWDRTKEKRKGSRSASARAASVDAQEQTGINLPQKRRRLATDLGSYAEEKKNDGEHCSLAPFDIQQDPNKNYVEEEAHLFHNPPLPSCKTEGVLPKDLPRIPPPSAVPEPPTTGKCTWSFDEGTRVYLADFSMHGRSAFPIDPVDERFMLGIMERDDITLVSEGLLDADALDRELWSLDNIAASFDGDFYHRFRRFDTKLLEDGTELTLEIDSLYSMQMMDYRRYLDQREGCLAKGSKEREFIFQDNGGMEHKIDVVTSALYMIDLDLNKLLPSLGENFAEAFRYASVLPGGRHCMMNKVTSSARPFMGPNLFITPPASFTQFHQDGHGTVDSGHIVLSGYNEVIMLRRLTERHKQHALWLLTGAKEQADKPYQKFFDGLYTAPHDDNLGEKPGWPTSSQIQDCEDMGYCPSVIILQPGQLIHINKGRLHAFRKMSVANLRADDCHYELRNDLIAKHKLESEVLCISVAWDWMFRGLTARGINREVLTTLEAAALCRKRGRMSLAIPELSILRMAQDFAKRHTAFRSKGSIFGEIDSKAASDQEKARIDHCRGILPGLRYVVNEHVTAMELAGQNASRSTERGKRITLAKYPDTQKNPELSTVDPHGASDFMCKLCSKELSNVYFHCDGCEKLLSKDFNICVQCHEAKHYAKQVQMHPQNSKRHATINHVGDMQCDRSSRCPCRNGPCCKDCFYCFGCSCRCHSWFTLNFRLFDKDAEQIILKRVENVVGTWKDSEKGVADRYLDHETFTTLRLDAAKKYWGHGDERV